MTEALAAWTPRALSVLRIITGLMIIEHGMAKILGFPVLPAFANVQPLSLLGAAGFIELIGGALLILGPVHAARGFHPLRRNGGRLFHGARAQGFLSADQWRHAGDHVLFHLPVSVDRGRRAVEPRRDDEAELRGDDHGQVQQDCSAAGEPIILSIFRIVTGLLMFQYGVAKLLKFPAGTAFDKVQPLSLFGVAGMFELVGAGCCSLGLFTRCAAFILCGEMAFAYFISHFPTRLHSRC